MKPTFLILIYLALAWAQNPIPVPGLSLSMFNGAWYVIWEFNANTNNMVPNPVQCFELNITTYNTTGTLFQKIVTTQSSQNNTANFSINGGQASQWTLSGTQIDWIAVDPISQSWAVAGYVGTLETFVMSRNTSLSNLIMNAQIVLMKQEGYLVNSSNYYSYPSTNC